MNNEKIAVLERISNNYDITNIAKVDNFVMSNSSSEINKKFDRIDELNVNLQKNTGVYINNFLSNMDGQIKSLDTKLKNLKSELINNPEAEDDVKRVEGAINALLDTRKQIMKSKKAAKSCELLSENNIKIKENVDKITKNEKRIKELSEIPSNELTNEQKMEYFTLRTDSFKIQSTIDGLRSESNDLKNEYDSYMNGLSVADFRSNCISDVRKSLAGLGDSKFISRANFNDIYNTCNEIDMLDKSELDNLINDQDELDALCNEIGISSTFTKATGLNKSNNISFEDLNNKKEKEEKVDEKDEVEVTKDESSNDGPTSSDSSHNEPTTDEPEKEENTFVAPIVDEPEKGEKVDSERTMSPEEMYKKFSNADKVSNSESKANFVPTFKGSHEYSKEGFVVDKDIKDEKEIQKIKDKKAKEWVKDEKFFAYDEEKQTRFHEEMGYATKDGKVSHINYDRKNDKSLDAEIEARYQEMEQGKFVTKAKKVVNTVKAGPREIGKATLKVIKSIPKKIKDLPGNIKTSLDNAMGQDIQEYYATQGGRSL